MRRDDIPDDNGQGGWFIFACGLALSILMLMLLAGLAAGNGSFY